MSINGVSSVSFKACIPVKYFAKNPQNGEYVPVVRNENIRKCHGTLVRNLNGTAKSKTDYGLVNFYRGYDSDYRNVPVVHSVYKQRGPVVYLVSGRDVDIVNQMAKPVGIAKGASMDVYGHTKTFDAMSAARTYQTKVQYYIDRNCPRVKSKDDKHPLELHMYFNPEYKKRSGELKGFTFESAQFVDEKTQQVKGEYSAK